MDYTMLKEGLPLDEQIYITGHIHPDGDCIGAALSLYHLLKNDGYNVQVFLEEKPVRYEFLEGYKAVKTLETFQQTKEHILQSAYRLIIVDSGDSTRIEPFIELYENAVYTINIDHHQSNTSFCDSQRVDVSASSTCEVVGMMLGLHEGVSLQDIHVATALYTGLIYDTGLFKHDCTRKETHQIAAQLVDAGVDQTFLINTLYFTKTRGSLKALEIALSHMVFLKNEEIVLSYIDVVEMEGHNLVKSDTEAIVNQLLEVETGKISCFILGMAPGEYKVSFRSKVCIDVCEIALKYKGGGHLKAAGCTMKGSLKEVLETVQRELVDTYERHTQCI